MRKLVLSSLTFLALISMALGASASAETLTTPALFVGGPSGQNVCVAINVGTAPITVTVEVIGLLSGTDSETCTLQPNLANLEHSCQAFQNDFAFCRVTTTEPSSVRAVMINRSTASPFTIFATVEAH